MNAPYISIVNHRHYMTSVSAEVDGRKFYQALQKDSLPYYSDAQLLAQIRPEDNAVVHPELLNPLSALSDLMTTLQNKKKQFVKDTGIMPPGLLYLNNNYLIFERPPTFQNVQIIPALMEEINYDKHQLITMRLPIPWQVYIVNYVDNGTGDLYCGNVKMHFTHGPIQSLDDQVFLPPLNNFYSSGDLCRPMYSSLDDIERFPKNVAGVIQAAFDWIWNSGTNIDLTIAIVQMFNQFDAKTRYDNTLFTYFPQHQRHLIDNIANISAINTYYCSFSQQQMLFELWEQLTLEQVVSLQWPNPMPHRQYHNEVRDMAESRTPEQEVLEEDMHYDEEDNSYYQCDEEDCHCSGPQRPSLIEVARDNDLWPPAPMTLRQSFQHMIAETQVPSMTLLNSTTMTRDIANRMIDYTMM